MTVWKYRLGPFEEQFFMLPAGAQILTAQLQNGAEFLWVLVNPDAPLTDCRYIRRVLTGEKTGSNLGKYIATIQNDWFVTHWFEVAK